jgi:hypothetical protein
MTRNSWNAFGMDVNSKPKVTAVLKIISIINTCVQIESIQRNIQLNEISSTTSLIEDNYESVYVQNEEIETLIKNEPNISQQLSPKFERKPIINENYSQMFCRTKAMN